MTRTVHAAASRDSLRWWPTLAAGLFSFAAYALTASGEAYWLDSAEFTAAAAGLDIAHPPGHPLASLWGQFFCLLPVGPISYRVALSQAAAGALAIAALERAFALTLRHTAESAEIWTRWVSLGLSSVLATSSAYWFQAARAEVYALQAGLVCLAFERMVYAAVHPDARDPRPLYSAALWLGLGLTNHHLVAMLALPSLGCLVIARTRDPGLRVPFTALLVGTLSLCVYAYLPLRAAAPLVMDLGHPISLERLYWVVSAQVYARNMGSGATQPLSERGADALVLAVTHLTAPLTLLAVVGAYGLLRSRRTRLLAGVWGLGGCVSFLVRTWLGPVRNNPDILGYLMPGLGALAGLSAAAIGLLVQALRRAYPAHSARFALTAALVVMGFSGWTAYQRGGEASLLSFHATDLFAEERMRAVPADAVVVLTTPEPVFAHWQAQVEGQQRPDVTLLPMPFVEYGGRIARDDPQVESLLAAYARTGWLDPSRLRALSAHRPVLIEADVRLAPPLLSQLLPDGLLYRVIAGSPTRRQLENAAREREQTTRRLETWLAAEPANADTTRQLVWLHYVDALYFAAHGERDAALFHVRRCLALAPLARHARALARAVEQLAPTQRLDVRPFLLGPEAR